MATELGKFLKKLRIDRGEVLKHMAEKLKVTSSFLSAVENGKKRMPSAWMETIIDLYELDEQKIIDFEKAIAKTEENVEMNISNLPMPNKEIAVSFARKFQDFDEIEIEQIRKIMEGAKRR